MLTHRKSEQRSVHVIGKHGIWQHGQDDRVKTSERDGQVVQQNGIDRLVTGYPTADHSSQRVGYAGDGHQPRGPVFVHAHTLGFTCSGQESHGIKTCAIKKRESQNNSENAQN